MPLGTQFCACICGTVSFRVSGELSTPAACHCCMCRRWHGALGIYTSIDSRETDFKDNGDISWYHSSEEADRGFCKHCGSKLFWRKRGDSGLDIAIGCLKMPSGLKLSKHIWVAYKGDYYDITDNLPQFSYSSAKAHPSKPASVVTTSPSIITHHGHCLCGKVHITVSGSLRDIIQCHCDQCRCWHGHAPAYTKAYWKDITLSGWDQTWYRSSNTARRGFCSTCGTSLFWERVGADVVSIPAGIFQAPISPRQKSHIFVAFKGDYYDIADNLPQLREANEDALAFDQKST